MAILSAAQLPAPALVSGGDDFDTQMLYFTCSSLSADDHRLYLLSNRNGHANVWMRELDTGRETMLTQNTAGLLKSYVYFDGTPHAGLGKASVCLDCARDVIYFLQGDALCRVSPGQPVQVLNQIPAGRITAFTHVSADGTRLCVPMTDARALDYNPDTEGSGLDHRPVYDIDGRVQAEGLCSYLCVYDTASGRLLYEETVPKCWITHVQFNPVNHDQILYNHEWASFDCGIRRMWLYDHATGQHLRLRTPGVGRSSHDWVCHEMWREDGGAVIYHGALAGGPAFVGRVTLSSAADGFPPTLDYCEIPLPAEYDAYGHFTMNHAGSLVCDGYFKFPGEIKQKFENSTDNGPDPHKKDGAYISVQKADWEHGVLHWVPLCRHGSDWLGQDAHPHAIYNHRGDTIYFSSRTGGHVRVYSIPCPAGW